MNIIPFRHLSTFLSLLVILGGFLISCENEKPTRGMAIEVTQDRDTLVISKEVQLQACLLKDRLDAMKLCNLQRDSLSFMVDLKYTTMDNFMEMDLYGCLDSCYLQCEVAEKLTVAQNALQAVDSNLVFLIYDGVRPLHVQQMMWDSLDMPVYEKVKFVSNPKYGSLHNFGAAVDLTLYDVRGDSILDMGTPYDYIGVEAWPTQEYVMLRKGILTEDHIKHRKLLRNAMRAGGFFNIQTEWWHFNSCRRAVAKQKYTIVP